MKGISPLLDDAVFDLCGKNVAAFARALKTSSQEELAVVLERAYRLADFLERAAEKKVVHEAERALFLFRALTPETAGTQ